MKYLQNFPIKISSLVSYDSNWSAFLVRIITKKDKTQKSDRNLEKFLPYIDLKKRIAIPPDDFLKQLKRNEKAYEKFEKLSFTHKKEYVESILEAKKEETRKKRILKAIEMLSK